jgi:hypothetical protein
VYSALALSLRAYLLRNQLLMLIGLFLLDLRFLRWWLWLFYQRELIAILAEVHRLVLGLLVVN